MTVKHLVSNMSPQQIDVKIAPSQMEAYLKIEPPANGGSPEDGITAYQALEELRAHGVIFGINREAIESLLTDKRWGEFVPVARGVNPLLGEPGRIEYFFDTSPNPKLHEMEDGRINFRDIGLIHVVRENDVLARTVPPKNGISGTTVLGGEIPARPGPEVFIKAGKLTRFSDHNPYELLAEATGSVSLTGGRVDVEKTFIVAGDVDFSIGNINFPGDVLIHGDVKCGFAVKAGGKIEVRGVVEDATLEAQGDILITGGFEGTGRGLIRGSGNVHVKFVENQTIEAAGSVYIAHSALNAQVSAGDSIRLDTGSGVVRGGRLRAQGWIAAKSAGNVNYTPTLLEIFQEGRIHPKLEKLELEVTLQQVNLARTRVELSLLLKKRVADREEHKQVEEEIVKLGDRMESIRADLRTAILTLKEFKAGRPEARSMGCVQISQIAYPGVRIIMDNLKYTIQDELRRAYFKKCGLEIAVLSSEEASHEDIRW